MIAMLLGYDAAGDVVATLDYMVARDADGNVIGLIDFEAHELAGGELTDIWIARSAVGSKTWPEWLGAAAHDFRVELAGPPGAKRIVALVHKASGHRRERAVLEAEIAGRIAAKAAEAAARGDELRATEPRRDERGRFVPLPADPPPEPADLRDLVGGPDRPLRLDERGATMHPARATMEPRPRLPLIPRREG